MPTPTNLVGIINAANIRTGEVVTALPWDIAHALRPHLTFRGETYLRWDRPPESVSGDYSLTFQKVDGTTEAH